MESNSAKAPTFRFILPFEGSIGGIAEDTTTTTNVRTIRVSGRPDDNNKKSILVAEDEDSNYELVRIVLHKRYELMRAHNGIEAVTLNEEEKPDLILMDIRMPEMNGLALSAYAFEENIRDAQNWQDAMSLWPSLSRWRT